MKRRSVPRGAWESLVGYSRAVRVGQWVSVAANRASDRPLTAGAMFALPRRDGGFVGAAVAAVGLGTRPFGLGVTAGPAVLSCLVYVVSPRSGSRR